ncbi:hypothetical protein OIU74_015981 [Salix koriyanagi]|uniref:Uncharacterized protein n=1 Tax=Salix koriyanagi TaxID=2511006 RepID=A0A9Q0PNP6_9ROSI|nr:hypothetical protein OIU74_015981 [Salix koriyanagi]
MRLKRGQESKSSDVIDFLKEGKERRDVFESYSSISRKEETIGKRALGRARSRRLSPKRAPLDDTTNQKNATQKGSRNSIPSSTLKQEANSSSVKTKK